MHFHSNKKFPFTLTPIPLLIMIILAGTAILVGVQGETNMADHPVISEIYYDTVSYSDSEFIEFYNPTQSPIDLTDWEFKIGSNSWINFSTGTDVQTNLTIPAGGFLLLVHSAWSTTNDEPTWPAGDVEDYLGLSNGGSTIAIRDGMDAVVDSVTYTGEADPENSVERKATSSSTATTMRGSDETDGNAYDTDDFAGDFVAQSNPQPQNTISDPEFYTAPTNQSPIADPGGPYQCDLDQTITLDGSNSYDPDGTITAYEWDLNDDGVFDDAAGETTSFTCTNAGTTTIGLKVTDDGSSVGTETTTVSTSSGLDLAVEDNVLAPDGTSTTTVTASYDVEGETVTFETELGVLSADTEAIGSDGTAAVTLTSPSTPGPSIVTAEVNGELAATAIFFQGGDLPNIAKTSSTLIPSGQTQGIIDAETKLGAVIQASKKASALEQRAGLTMAEYTSNPADTYPLDGKSDRYFILHSDHPDSISSIVIKFYFDTWPATPRARFWDDSASQWISIENYSLFPEDQYLEVTIDAASPLDLINLYHYPLAVGGLDSREIEVTSSGWNMISVPITPEVPDPSVLFQGIKESKICRWNQSLNGDRGGYMSAADSYDHINVTRGNWIYLPLNQAPATFPVTGVYDGTVEISLGEAGWHQIGLPFDYSWNGMGVVEEGTEGAYDMMSATGEGNLIMEAVWAWDPERGRYYVYDTEKEDKVLETGTGYWIYTMEPNLTLVAPYKSPPPIPETTCKGARPLSPEMMKRLPQPPPPPDSETREVAALAYPNPTSVDNSVTFAVQGVDTDEIRVMVTSAAGEKVYDTGFTDGSAFTWDLKGKTGEEIANGIYLYEITGLDWSGRNVIREVGKLLVLE